MIIGIDPKVDYAFKHLFGRDATRPILIDIVNSVLDPAPAERVRDIEILNPFNPKEALDDKLSILDVKARDQSGRQFNIEMQMLVYPFYEKRILHYACKLHQQQLHEGQDYSALQPTISISFLNHVWFPDVPGHHLRFRLLEETLHLPLTEGLQFHILELPKFTKPATHLSSSLDVWLYFLKHADKMDTDALPDGFQQGIVRRALEELAVLSQTDLERERYESRRKAQLDELTLVNFARREGQARGEQIGLIHAFERVLQRPESPADTLAALSLDELTRLAEQLQAEVLKQR
jgi:predicted transposase/invertase (TIGR01784 family)